MGSSRFNPGFGTGHHSSGNHHSPCSGFTLMEVVVAMVLVSMVTLIATLGFRLAVRAWERGENEGNSRQISSAIPALLEKQLDSLKKNVSFSKGKNKVLLFSGNEKGVSFFTSYSPQGSAIQGLVRVTYIFDRAKTKLFVYEQAITRLKDIDEQEDPLSDKWNNELKPVSILDGIDNFSIMFLKKTNKQDDKDSFANADWKTTWRDNRVQKIPAFVKLILAQGKKAFVEKWYFKVGGE